VLLVSLLYTAAANFCGFSLDHCSGNSPASNSTTGG
jgi:hypothetical protein